MEDPVMVPHSLSEFAAWLDAYGAAWRSGDPRAVTALFTEDAQYYEMPFGEPLRGRAAIARYWTAGPGEAQRNVDVSLLPLAMVERTGIARWHASFVRLRSGKHVELDGCLVAEFTVPGKCSVFREWWHRREREGLLQKKE
jgi:hypothetical protein